jgi:site-specific DNA recombinase
LKNIAIYSRKSRETDKGESISTQIQLCKEYFLRDNIDCKFETFQDEGFSGGNTNRPEFQRMMLLAKHKQFDIIACYKVDRISRNIVDFMNTFDTLEKHNVSLVSISEGFDPTTPVGRIMMTMLAGFAEMERMNTAQRVKDNLKALAKLGRWSGGTPPTGYRSVRVENGDKTAMYLELNNEWKDKIEFMYKSVSEGNSIRHLAKILDMPNKTIANIISNPTYCKSDETSKKYLESIGFEVFGELDGYGYLSYNRRPRGKNGKKKFNSDEKFVAVSRHEGVVDSSLWISANEKVSTRADEAKPRISSNSFLAHIVKCSCGSGMYIEPGNRRKDGTRNYYFCCSRRKINKDLCSNGWLNAANLENDILQILKKSSEDKSILENYIDSKPSPTIDSDISNTKRQILSNTNRLNSLTEKFILLENSAAKLIANKMNEISALNDKLNSELLNLERKKLLNSIDNVNVDKIQIYICDLLSNWETLSIEDKQTAMQNIFDSILWDGKKGFNIKLNI